MKTRRFVVGALLGTVVTAALACGVCKEDKIAATYDYAAEQRALANRRAVVYCAVDGHVDAATLKNSVRGVRGVDATTLRLSASPAALSFVLDTTRQSAAAAVRAIEARAGAKLTILKVAAPMGM